MTVMKRDILGSAGPTGIPTGEGELSATPIGAAKFGDEAAFNSARVRSDGEKPGGSAGFGLGAGDTDFSTAKYNDSDTPSQIPGGGKDIDVGTLVQKNYGTQGQSGDTGSDTSGYGKVL
jgi:hypothetical protein